MKEQSRPMQLRLREQNKLDKLQRIKSAAADLFTELGYESATMRTIASRAGVGLGTLFLYAKDKRDLVFLIFNEQLDNIVERAFGSAKPETPFLEQLVSVFSVFYAEFSKSAPLSRILLKELTFLSEGIHAQCFQERRRDTMKRIEKLVAFAQENGSIRCREDPAFIARHIFFVFAGAIRWWFASEELLLSTGIADLTRLFKLHLMGLDPAPAALGTTQPGRRQPALRNLPLGSRRRPAVPAAGVPGKRERVPL